MTPFLQHTQTKKNAWNFVYKVLLARDETGRGKLSQRVWRVSQDKTRAWIHSTPRGSSTDFLPSWDYLYGYVWTIFAHPKEKQVFLTFIDHFTKYLEAIPIQDIAAETCTRAYATQVIARHSTGSFLVTDQGRSFTSVFFKETCKILGIKQVNTSAYHPQASGTIERYHKTMNQGLSQYVNASGTNWDTLISF